jgi:hypothetical protein
MLGLVVTRLGLIDVEFDVKSKETNDDDIANVEGKSYDR